MLSDEAKAQALTQVLNWQIGRLRRVAEHGPQPEDWPLVQVFLRAFLDQIGTMEPRVTAINHQEAQNAQEGP